MIAELLGQSQVGLVEIIDIDGFSPAMRILNLDSANASFAQAF